VSETPVPDANLASVDDVVKRLDWDPSDAELRVIEAAVEDVSELVRAAAGRQWTSTARPALARTTTLNAVVRYMKNTDGLTTSRAGDETAMWDGIGDKAGAPYLTDAEERKLQALVGGGGLVVLTATAWPSERARLDPVTGLMPGYANVLDGEPMPYPFEAE